MKKNIAILLALAINFIAFAQDKEPLNFKKNELKINVLSTITKFPEFTYERILNKKSSVGLSYLISIQTYDQQHYDQIKYMLTSYYRYYFGKRPAAGLFLEGFGALNKREISGYYEVYNPNTQVNELVYDKYLNFALGLGAGVKWVNEKGFLFELNGGIGQNLNNTEKNNLYGDKTITRVGVTFGRRF